VSDGQLAKKDKELADKESIVKSNILDIKLAQKELKLKDERLTETLRRETDLMIVRDSQRKEIDKLAKWRDEKVKEIASLKE
jgi:hypothetical protein